MRMMHFKIMKDCVYKKKVFMSVQNVDLGSVVSVFPNKKHAHIRLYKCSIMRILLI